jgi:hypothetical protein
MADKLVSVKFLQSMAVFSGPSRNIGDVREISEGEAKRLAEIEVVEIITAAASKKAAAAKD